MNLCNRFRKMYLGHIFMGNLPRFERIRLRQFCGTENKNGRASVKLQILHFNALNTKIYIKKKESTKALDTCNTMCAGDQKENFWNENGEQYIGVVDFSFHF